MSQKRGNFQSRKGNFAKKPGQKSGYKGGGGRSNRSDRGERDDNRSGKRGFSDRSQGDNRSRGGYKGKRDRDDNRGGRGSGGGGYRGRDDRNDNRSGGYKGNRDRNDSRSGGYKGNRDRDDRGGQRSGGYKGRDDNRRSGGYKGRDDNRSGGYKGRDNQRQDRPRQDRYRDDNRRGPRREASEDTRRKLKSERSSYGAPSPAFLFGAHAVCAALLNPDRQHQRLLCTESGYESIVQSYQDAKGNELKVPEVTFVEKEDLHRLVPRDAVHQGVVLDSKPLEDVFLQDILIAADENTKVLVLDQVTDPHNVGAILRSASAFGASAVVMQKLHAPDVTGTLAKIASGAVEYVPIVREVNLSRALEQLKDAGFFCVGLDERGKETLAEMDVPAKTALVLGAEGKGLRRLVSEKCDALVRLPTSGPIGSLNVSNAAATALYELVRAQ